MKLPGKIFNRTLIALASLLLAPLTHAAQATPITIDGQYDEWDLSKDFFAPMHATGDRDKELLSNAYLRYDRKTKIVSVLVLQADRKTTTQNDAWIKVYHIGRAPRVDNNSGNNGAAPDFSWVMDGDTRIGWEGSFYLDPGLFGDAVEIHVKRNGRIASTGKGRTAEGETLNPTDFSPENKKSLYPPHDLLLVNSRSLPNPKINIKKHTGKVQLNNVLLTDRQRVPHAQEDDCFIEALQLIDTINCSASRVTEIDLLAHSNITENVYAGLCW
ncbi:MAG: hypothetical protein D3924_01000 [Candidatus Electrothrix sp. AR4]|nr:hypothetical protein [Candidatus Electrothrix sp. AR4]